MIDSWSLRSSDETCSSISDEREKAKILQKVIGIKDKLRIMNERREADVERFLRITKQSEVQRGLGADNPQLIRIRNNFDRQNRKHTQEADILQKKLNHYEECLKAVESGNYEPSPSRTNVFSQGIRKAGANMKEMTETVITAPLELAQKLKNAFESSDDVYDSKNLASRVGQSKFFTERRSANDDINYTEKTQQKPMQKITDGFETCDYDTSFDDRTSYKTANNSLQCQPDQTAALNYEKSPEYNVWSVINDQLKAISKQVKSFDEKYETLRCEIAHEIALYSEALEEERFKITKLEKLLNDTIELHQAEFETLKEQNFIATRVDYQHNDRFKNLEEKLESLENNMIRMENSITDTLDVKLSNPVWGNAALSGVNIVVELLKLLLFLLAYILDFLRPLTGSRNRAGIILAIFIVLLIFSHYFTEVKFLKMLTKGYQKENDV